MKFYLLFIYGGVESNLHGPFESSGERDREARALYAANGKGHGYIRLNVDEQGEPHTFDFTEEELSDRPCA